MKSCHIIFPHQLFEQSPLFEFDAPIFLVEEELFFNQYKFHKQKITFHRATMKSYEAVLKKKNNDVMYIEATDDLCDIRTLIPYLANQGVTEITCIHPVDNWLEKRLEEQSEAENITLSYLDSPMFLNNHKDLEHFFKPEKKNFHQTTFYKQERKKRQILLDQRDEPIGGKWTYDTENRKKYPSNKIPPAIQFPEVDSFYEEAVTYTNEHFKNNLGELSTYKLYPSTHIEAKAWLEQFLEYRFFEFGPYEDAVVAEHSILNHSVLTPMLNVGLLTPNYVVDRSLTYATEHQIPINSVEGFIRQIIGWREFMRGMYHIKGSHQRTRNFWNFKRKIPQSFYDGTTGIKPFDDSIKKALKTGYCHHIERLMILGNFMLLCEINPDDVYQWFMELFIDAYDWVMVPNVYGMSQFADGGLFATKPYISGSNYIMKMSNYKKGDWQDTWDGLFWNFMDKQRDFFKGNPRLGMLLGNFDRMNPETRETHLKNAEAFLNKLDQ